MKSKFFPCLLISSLFSSEIKLQLKTLSKHEFNKIVLFTFRFNASFKNLLLKMNILLYLKKY